MRSGRLSMAIAGGNDEVGRTDESTKQVHMTWVEDATKYEDKQCLQRDVTEVDISRRDAGRTCLMFYCDPRVCNEYIAMVETGNECLLGNLHVVHAVRISMAVCCAEVLVQPNFFWCCLTRCLWKTRPSNALVVVWVGNGAPCVSRDVTLHRLSAYS